MVCSISSGGRTPVKILQNALVSLGVVGLLIGGAAAQTIQINGAGAIVLERFGVQ